MARHAATTNSNGASKIGIEDSAGLITATQVEAALAEMALNIGVTKVKSSNTSRATEVKADDPHLAEFDYLANKLYSLEAFIEYDQNAGDLSWVIIFSSAVQSSGMTWTATDRNAVRVHDADIMGSTQDTVTTDGQTAGLVINGWFHTHANTAGDLAFKWARRVTSATDTVLIKGSYMTVTQLD